jgi:hypothetical protein
MARRRTMPSASNPGSVAGALVMSLTISGLIVMSTALQGSKSNSQLECERGVLDAGENGLNVLVYELCPNRMSVGFQSSEVVEEISCRANGNIDLWLLADVSRCKGRPASSDDQVYELWEPLRGIGGATSAPLRQLLRCRIGFATRATILVPDARDAILETRTGDTKFEKLTRQLISQCIRPDA